jgi:hypothetical protein
MTNDEKSKTSSSNIKYKFNYMRNKNGSISKVYIDKIRNQYKTLLKTKDKKKLETFLTKEFKKGRDDGVGLLFTDKGIGVKDLYISKDRNEYISLTKKKFVKHYNISVTDVKNKEKALETIKSKISLKRATKPEIVRRETIAKGVLTKYIFKYNEDFSGGETFEGEDDDEINLFIGTVRENIERALISVSRKHKGQKFVIRLSKTMNPFTDPQSFGLKTYGLPTISELVSIFEKKMKQAYERYKDEIYEKTDFKYIGIGVISEPYGQILGAGGHRTKATAEKSWFISNTASRTNCFYRCLATQNILVQLHNENDLDNARKWLIEDDSIFKAKIRNRASDMKSGLKSKSIRATNETDIQLYVDKCNKKNSHNRCEVIIYNNVYEKVKTIRPTNYNGELIKNTYEVQLINHHFVALIRWFKINNIRPILDEMIQIEKVKSEEACELKKDIPEDENELIDREPKWVIKDGNKLREFCKKEIWNKELGANEEIDYDTLNAKDKAKYERWFKHRYGRTEYCDRPLTIFNEKIGAYDLEATPNGVEGCNFRAYRLSFAYNVLEEYFEDGITKYRFIKIKTLSFGGANCVEKWFEWLYKNRQMLDGYTLYAHNGGKFDVMLLLNDYILKRTSKWVLEEGTLIVLNGAYLSFCLTSKEGDPESINTIAHNATPAQIKKNKDKYIEGDLSSFITFRDSYRLLPAGLKKLCEEFDVEHKKISEVVNFDEVNINNCYGGELNKFRPFSDEKFKIELCNLVYCNYDVLGLLEVLNKFNISVYKACEGINISDCITGASLSKKHYFNTYYNKKLTPVYNLDTKNDEFCRSGYYGGRCEAFYIGEQIKKLYYYDFTSLYPDVGRKFVPYGEPKRVSEKFIEKWMNIYNGNKDILIERSPLHLREFYKKKYEKRTIKEWRENLPLIKGIVKVLVRTKDFKALPLHALKHKHRLTFAHFAEWTELTMWFRELLYGIELDIYEYKLIDAIEFDGGHCYVATDYMNDPIKNKKNAKDREHFFDEGILKDFFTDSVERKADAKKAGQPAMAQAYKIIANSGYGFWGLNADGDGEGRDGMTILNEDDDYFWELMANEVVSNVGKVGEYIMVRTAMKMSVRDFNVAIAAAICSEARMKTYRFLKAVKDNGCNILYCDTDSCICDLKLNDYPDMMEEFCWDGTGEELGSMKNECLEKVEGYYKNKIMKELGEDIPKDIMKKKLKEYVNKEMEKDGGELSFDKGIIGGCKQYSLHKTLLDGGVVVAGACKGVKRKLNYEEFRHLLYGTMMDKQLEDEKGIKERNPLFEAGGGYRLYEKQTQFRSSISDHIKEGSLTDIKKVEIDKSIKINYTKGIVNDDGWVKPLILTAD